ncbi:hypothetical protein LSH36_30g00028 [Paralvinella palmiformis]|uniref:Uncharacterized protein n=1 Tax=Paralvinella palmiformis TaxID=53620 RepID=A0AAD9NG11_9ANNE|nr:hypothetical protein LSH36_30g00028 [Paralvinella palmiformis]
MSEHDVNKNRLQRGAHHNMVMELQFDVKYGKPLTMEHWQKRHFIPRVKSANIPSLRVDYPRFPSSLAGSSHRSAYTKTIECQQSSKNQNRELKRSKVCNIYFRPLGDKANYGKSLVGTRMIRDCLSASTTRPETKILDIAMEKCYIYEHNSSLPSGGHDIRSAMLLTMAQFNRPIEVRRPVCESYGSPRNGSPNRRHKQTPNKPMVESLQYKKTPESILNSVRDSQTLNSYCRRGTPTMCDYCEVLGPSSCNKCLRKLNQHIADDVNRSSPMLESTLRNIVAPKLAKLMDRGNRKYCPRKIAGCETTQSRQCDERGGRLPDVDGTHQTTLVNNGKLDNGCISGWI